MDDDCFRQKGDLAMNKLKVFVLAGQDFLLAEIPDRPFIEKVDLSVLEGVPWDLHWNCFAESRFYLSNRIARSTLLIDEAPEYIGVAAHSWNRKFPFVLPVEKLDELKLEPNVVWCAAIAGEGWAAESDHHHPGMSEILTVLAEKAGLKKIAGPAFYCNNFIAHRSVVESFVTWFKKWAVWVHDEYGPIPPYLVNQTRGDKPLLHPAYLMERLTMLYFANRGDLVVRQIPKVAR